MTEAPPLLAVTGLSKAFPGVQALAEVEIALSQGECLAVIGENGAGKSTLMKILAGVQLPDAGEIRLQGERVHIDSVEKATSLGIALIHQELNLCDNLTVGASVFLGREPRRWIFLAKKEIQQLSLEILARVGLEVDPEALVGSLSPGQQQLLEIASALSVDARILIMDEPTSSLTQSEAERLFALIRDLRAQGVGIIYITHRLLEVRQLADRVLVLRDGRNAGELAREEADHDRMVQLMVGRDVSRFYQRQTQRQERELALEVRNVCTFAHRAWPLDFDLYRGEVLGLAGLVGAGRTELLETIFGIHPRRSGQVLVGGRRLEAKGPAAAVAAGLALVPEDRQLHGVFLDLSLRQNLALASLRQDQRMGFVNRRAEARRASAMIDRLDIRAPSDHQILRFLSGGNQQKVVLGKWLTLKPKVLLLDEPTRGVDVGAKEEIYRLMDELALEGVGILFSSSEMEEIIGISDRVLVMHEGRIRGELQRQELSEEAILKLATGGVAAV